MSPFKKIKEEIKDKKEEEEPKQDEPPKIGLSEQLQELNEKIDIISKSSKGKEKKAKLKGFSQKKLKRYNKGKRRAILMLRRNTGAELVKGEFIQGMVKVGENYYDGSAIYIWLFKRFNKYVPFYIIPEWSIRPLSREAIYERAKEENTLIDSQIITLRAMKSEQVGKQDGKKVGGMAWIGIVIAGIVVIWLFLGGK